MGFSASGEVYYGYDLGGGDWGWYLREYDEESRELRIGWVDPTEVEDDGVFAELAEDRLEDHMGGMIDAMRHWWQAPEDETKKQLYQVYKAAKERTTVNVFSYGHHEFPRYLLAIKASRIWVSWGEAAVLDLPVLASQPADEGWDLELARALEILQITPVQDKPEWLLVSDYG